MSTQDEFNSTIKILDNCLHEVEVETNDLQKDLKSFALSGDSLLLDDSSISKSFKTLLGEIESSGISMESTLMQSFLSQKQEYEAMHRSYNNMATRVSNTESTIQSLKLHLCSLQAQKDLMKKDIIINEKMISTNNEFENEIKKLNKDLMKSRREFDEVIAAKRRVEVDLKRVQSSLEFADAAKISLSGQVDDLQISRSKLQRRLAELKEDLNRETSIRSGLEESQQNLITRLNDAESLFEEERGRVETLENEYRGLKRELVKLREKFNEEMQKREQAETALAYLKNHSEINEDKVEELVAERDMIDSALNKYKLDYVNMESHAKKNDQIITENQEKIICLENEISHLHSALKATAAENNELRNTHELEILKLRNEITEKANLHSENTELDLEKLKTQQLQQKLAELNDEVSRCQTRCQSDNDNLKIQLQQKEQEIVRSHREIVRFKEMQDATLRDKEELILKMNSAADNMMEERVRLSHNLEETRIELEGVKQSRDRCEEEALRLLEKVGALEQQKSAHLKLNETLQELLDSKNKLAYEKGSLEVKVKNLEDDLREFANCKKSLTQLKRQNAAFESQFIKLTSEYNIVKMSSQRAESHLQQLKEQLALKEDDHTKMADLLSECSQEKDKLLQDMDKLEDRQKFKLADSNRFINDIREDNERLSNSLQSLMDSHTQLQSSVIDLQAEIGRKDAHIASLTSKSSERKKHIEDMEDEIRCLQSKLLQMNVSSKADDVTSLKGVLNTVKKQNLEVSDACEHLTKQKNVLQQELVSTEEKLKDRDEEVERLLRKISFEKERQEEEIKYYEHRIEQIRNDHSRDNEIIIKRLKRENNDSKKHYDDAIQRISSLSKDNNDLRKRIDEVENLLAKEKLHVKSQKAALDHFQNTRQSQKDTSDRVETMRKNLEDLAREKREYSDKNRRQEETIKSFVTQIKSLEDELRDLARINADTAEFAKKHEMILSKEREINASLRARNKYLKDKLLSYRPETPRGDEIFLERDSDLSLNFDRDFVYQSTSRAKKMIQKSIESSE